MGFKLTDQSLHRIAQAAGDWQQYDEIVDTIDTTFKTPYAQGDMVNSLFNLIYELEGAIELTLDRLSTEVGTSWTNAILNFRDDLDRESLDTSRIDVDELSYRTKEAYMEKLKSGLREFFETWRNQGIENDTADDILSEFTSALAEGYRP